MSVDSPEELEGLRGAGGLAARVLREGREAVAPGVTTGELDALAAEIIASEGGRSGPIITYGFPGAICISVGDEAVHGIPGARRIGAGDLVQVDVGGGPAGSFGDTATTVAVEPVGSADERLISATRAALARGIATATAGGPGCGGGGGGGAGARDRDRDGGRPGSRRGRRGRADRRGARLQRPARAHRPRHRARAARG